MRATTSSTGHGRRKTSESGPRTQQLCAQARRSLAMAIGAAIDPRLRDVTLMDVTPHPDTSCLRVVVSAPADHIEFTRHALNDAASYLRRELAADIRRRRAPELVFSIVPQAPQFSYEA